MRKKGQITAFLVIGIVIVIIAGITIYFFNQDNDPLEIDVQYNPSEEIKFNIEQCMESTQKDGLNFISHQGGYYVLREPKTNYVTRNTVYYYYENESYLPSVIDIAEQLDIYIEENLGRCLNFTSFEERGIEVDYFEPYVKSVINKNGVFSTLETKVNVGNIILNDISAHYDSRIYHLVEAGNRFVEKYDKYEGKVCITCNIDISDEYLVLINMRDRAAGDLQITIMDDSRPSIDENERERLVFSIGDFIE